MNLIERAGRRLAEAQGRRPEETRDPQSLPNDGPGLRPEAPVRARQSGQHIDLDIQRLHGMGYTVPADQSALTEEFRLIKRVLLDAAFTKARDASVNPNLIMVTSCAPKEGKTFTSINLAFSMAFEHDMRVLLLDADLARPSIPRVLGFEPRRGLVDAVLDPSIELSDVLISSNIKNLTLLPAGQPTALSSELLASAKMTRFVDEVAKRFADGVVILDSAPVLARSESTVLARHVGQIVFVVEAERTSKGAIDDALRLLDRKRVRFVMNKAAPAPLRGGFGKYYYPYSGERT